ncbi:Holin-like protein CidA [Paenibacillus sp. CECT 9249]|uniref:CidA/LrgA family protein n=1 Tax=Paenibacillus sp. CECT 9249 TaxID=2845385 RepID=UPI001E43DD88|nr:CidA/LrgA family protein [Paenibacillus sp. CECT 9249]CAH0117891.1 Holin-like protein CidA [Paenibacillus sp. CECT 9249]
MWKIAKIIGQLGLLTGLTLLGNVISDYFGLPIPGSIIGLGILFALLQLKWIRLEWIEQGADWLLSKLLLFFIPSVVGIVQYQQLIASSVLRLIMVIGLSTFAVMACTGLLAEFISRKKGRETA